MKTKKRKRADTDKPELTSLTVTVEDKRRFIERCARLGQIQYRAFGLWLDELDAAECAAKASDTQPAECAAESGE